MMQFSLDFGKQTAHSRKDPILLPAQQPSPTMTFIQFAILLTGAAIAFAGPAPQAAATTTSPCSAAVSAIPSCGVSTTSTYHLAQH
jgi:hypothetical protein